LANHFDLFSSLLRKIKVSGFCRSIGGPEMLIQDEISVACAVLARRYRLLANGPAVYPRNLE
jgi:hypothetical protein